jgi:alpha-galactosidase
VTLKVTVIGGGSSMFVPNLLRRFLLAPCMHGGTVTLMDVDEGRLKVMDSLGRRLVEAEHADLKIESTVDQRESLVGADFVIVAISVGGMSAWGQDIEIPARYGIFMHIADTVGPGGIMRAFRNAPVMASIARDVADVAPGAWILNYSNPATAMTLALKSVPGVNAASVCSCTWMPGDAEWIAERVGVAPEEIVMPPLVAGLNHCAGIVELRLRDGRDAIALAREHVSEPIERWVLETYGMLPYCWAHWTEFYPQLQQLVDPYEGRAQGLAMAYGRRIYVMDEERQRAQKWADLADRWTADEVTEEISLAALPQGPEDQGIEVIDIIEAIAENRNELFIVNTTNNGAIDNMPDDSVVEVQAVIGSHGISPIHTGAIPEALATHLRWHASVQRLTVEAALSGDEQLAMQSFLHDPLLMARLDLDQTRALFKEMMDANRSFLPQFADGAVTGGAQ